MLELGIILAVLMWVISNVHFSLYWQLALYVLLFRHVGEYPQTRPKIHSTPPPPMENLCTGLPVILAPPSKKRIKKGKIVKMLFSSASPGRRRHRRRLLPARPQQEPPDDDVPGRPLLSAGAGDKEGEGGAAEVPVPVQGRAEGRAGEAGE